MIRISLLCAALLPAALTCDSLGVLPSATADGIGAMYGKNADRHEHESQPVAAVARATWPEGATIALDSGLVIPQVRSYICSHRSLRTIANIRSPAAGSAHVRARRLAPVLGAPVRRLLRGHQRVRRGPRK